VCIADKGLLARFMAVTFLIPLLLPNVVSVDVFIDSLNAKWAIKFGCHGRDHGFASHSLRRGGATWMLNQNIAPVII
jgi:hypothetical protein